MRKTILCMIVFIICISISLSSLATGFTNNSDEIEKAAKSVLKLYVYDSESAQATDYIATGSGFVAFNNSTLITNYHVIDDAVMVIGSDDDDNLYILDKVLCSDKAADIAILGFSESTDLLPLDLFADNQLKRGSPVVAIGSPKGLKNTVSSGIISSQYSTDGIPEIQITAPISPGSSGGALFNDNGKVIGVTSASYKSMNEFGENTDAQNLNFAVNISVAMAMFKAWDGKEYSIANHQSAAKMDYTGVYTHLTQPVDSSIEQESNSTDSWTCLNCGKENTSKFCLECGAERPYWICSCGNVNSSNKYCGECGQSVNTLITAFNDALGKKEEKNFDEAIGWLESLGQFDSGSFDTNEGNHVVASNYISEMYYDQALYLQENNGTHEEIIEAFEKAGDYADAKDQIAGEKARYLKAFYDAGIMHLNNKEYDEAIEAFQEADSYLDAVDQILVAYYAKGVYLLEEKKYEAARMAFTEVGEYKDAKEMILRANYLEAEVALENGETDKATQLFANAGEYKDAKAKIEQIATSKRQTIYDAAMSAFEAEDYDLATELFAQVEGYLDAALMSQKVQLKRIYAKINILDPATMTDKDQEELVGILDSLCFDGASLEMQTIYSQINYILARYEQDRDLDKAIKHYEDAGNYQDATELLKACRMMKTDALIKQGQIDDAIGYYQSNVDPKGEKKSDYAVIKPGDKGQYISRLLSMIKLLGIKTTGKIDTEEYKDEYIPYVQAIEEHFGLVADGSITIDELCELNGIIYPGLETDESAKLLEKLADLSFISKLPENHLSYDTRYVSAVKKAETVLGLKPDGIITSSEYNTIMEQHVDQPEDVSNLKAVVKNDMVSLTWSKAKGAVLYEVKRDNKVIGSTEKTSWTDKSIETEKNYTYIVTAKKHTISGRETQINVNVPRYYMPISVRELRSTVDAYIDKYVELKGLKPIDWRALYPNGDWSEGYLIGEGSQLMLDIQTKKGYGLVLCCYSGVNGEALELIFVNYQSWKSTGLLDNLKRSMNITVKGKVIDVLRYDFTTQYFPIVIVETVSWK